MKHLKSEFDKLSFKEFFLFVLCTALITSAVVAIFLSLYIPPEGEIHPSVLTYFGIASAFAAGLIGIDIAHNVKLDKFKEEIRDFIKHEGIPSNSNLDPVR